MVRRQGRAYFDKFGRCRDRRVASLSVFYVGAE